MCKKMSKEQFEVFKKVCGVMINAKRVKREIPRNPVKPVK